MGAQLRKVRLAVPMNCAEEENKRKLPSNLNAEAHKNLPKAD